MEEEVGEGGEGGGGQWQWEEPREWREFMFNLETPKPKDPTSGLSQLNSGLELGRGISFRS